MTKTTATAKPAAAPEPFRVPSLGEVSPEYAALLQRQGDLQNALNALERERADLQRAIASDRSPAVRPGVAALLGDDPANSRAAKTARLAEVRRAITDHEVALTTIRGRLATARGPASVAVCDAVKSEYSRRVAAVVAALTAADAARASYEGMRAQLEAEDVAWTRLGPLALGFMGEHLKGRSARVDAVIRDAREAGYVA
jgi:hypothetical protein